MTNGKENMKCRIFHVFPRDADVLVKKEGNKAASANKVASSRTASRKTTKEDGCQVCGKQDNCDSLMECDGCASRYCHTFCLGLTALPEGDWFCSKSSKYFMLSGSLPFSHLCIFLLVFRNVHATKATQETSSTQWQPWGGIKEESCFVGNEGSVAGTNGHAIGRGDDKAHSLQNHLSPKGQRRCGQSHWLFGGQLPAK